MKELKIGRLAAKPDIKEVPLKDGEIKKVCNTYMFIRDPYAPKNEKGKQAGVPIRLTAWDERAEALADCNKGEIVSVIGTTAAVKHADNDFLSYGLRVSSVYRAEKALDINKQMTALLNSFEKGDISCIYDIKTEKIVDDVMQLPEREEESMDKQQELDALDQTLQGYENFEDFDDMDVTI